MHNHTWFVVVMHIYIIVPPINIRVVNCVKDRAPQRSPNLNVCVMLLIISALDRHDNAWINRATLIYWTAYEAILLFDEICFPMNLLSPFFCVNCKLKNVERLCRCAWLPRTTCDCASSLRRSIFHTVYHTYVDRRLFQVNWSATVFGARRAWRYQKGKHNSYIEEEQTTQ
jgi:hypothetical protein